MGVYSYSHTFVGAHESHGYDAAPFGSTREKRDRLELYCLTICQDKNLTTSSSGFQIPTRLDREACCNQFLIKTYAFNKKPANP